MKTITFKDRHIFYGKEKIGTYRQAHSDRFIPIFIQKWDFMYYQFDFYSGPNMYEPEFREKIVEIIKDMYDIFENDIENKDVDKSKIHILTQEDVDTLNREKVRLKKLISFYESMFKIGYKVIQINESGSLLSISEGPFIALSFHLSHEVFPDIHENMINDSLINEIRDFLFSKKNEDQ